MQACTHTHTSCAPLQAQGGGSWAQCPEAPGASPSKCQAGTELGDKLQRTQGAAFLHRHPFPGEGQELSISSCPRTEGHQEPMTHQTSHGERKVCSLLRHSTCISFSLTSILQHLGSHPIVSRRKYGLIEVKPLVHDPQTTDGTREDFS